MGGFRRIAALLAALALPVALSAQDPGRAPEMKFASGFANVSLVSDETPPPPVDPNAHGTEPMQGHETTAPKPKHFFTAASEIVLLEAIPWAFDRYVGNEDFSRISTHTVS